MIGVGSTIFRFWRKEKRKAKKRCQEPNNGISPINGS